jgi:hypothetical protein
MVDAVRKVSSGVISGGFFWEFVFRFSSLRSFVVGYSEGFFDRWKMAKELAEMHAVRKEWSERKQDGRRRTVDIACCKGWFLPGGAGLHWQLLVHLPHRSRGRPMAAMPE